MGQAGEYSKFFGRSREHQRNQRRRRARAAALYTAAMSTSNLASLPRTAAPRILGILEYAMAPRRFALRNVKHFGRCYRVRGFDGDIVVTSEPDHIKRVFGADSDTFEPLAQNNMSGIVGKRSVLVTAGATHRRQRKLLTPPLGGARLRAFGATIQEIADAHVSSLHVGAELRALDLVTDFTLDVILRTVFGVTDPSETQMLRRSLRVMVHELPALAVFEPRLQKSWFRPWARYRQACESFDAWLREKVRARRAQPEPGEDVLSLLLSARAEDGSAMEYEELHDQLVTLLLAGHETTSIALASCLEQIHFHPAVLDRLRAELGQASASPEDVQREAYLAAVIDETLRIAPVVGDVARRARTEFWLDERIKLNPGQSVLVMIEALHYDPLLYPEPTRFRPERFLERKFTPYEFAPFGGGVRRCLGAAFSDYETKIFLASVLRRVELCVTRAQPDPRIRRNITMGPKHGVPMRVLGLRQVN